MADDPFKPIPNPIGDLLKAVDAAVPPILRQFARLQDLAAQFRPSFEALEAARRAVALAIPPNELGLVLESIRENARWAREAPKALQDALAGKTVVHQELSLPDIKAIIRAYNESGEDAAVMKVQELHEELLADGVFRKQFSARWEAAGRLPIMRDVLAAYDGGLYFAAIPPALAQAEGIAADFFVLNGLKFPGLTQSVRELHDGEHLFEPLVMSFLAGLLAGFDHGKPVPQLNRHAVQHGGDKTYGTRANAVTAIIWADYILGVTIEAKEKREAPPPPPRTDDPDASEP